MGTATTGTVYALVDPRDNRVRYIGATTHALETRLRGHLTGPAARRVKAWVGELAAEGLTPRIEPINENVPKAELRDVERTEITRRIVASEALLNESATAPARRYLEHRREQEREERDRAAWEHVANQVRAIVGGPLPPGDIAPIPLGAQSLTAYHDVMRIKDAPDNETTGYGDHRLSKDARFRLAQEKAGAALWLSVRPMWARLRGMAQRQFDSLLEARVKSVFKDHWTDLRDASRFLALLPWGIMAVGPWAALAERAGMDISGPAFIDWVTDDATAREALMVLLVRSGGRLGPLSVLDAFDTDSRPSTGLVVMTAAHHPGFDLPRELHLEMTRFLSFMVRGQQLTPAMSALLTKLDPNALDTYLGPDITIAIDTRLGLPRGTARNVLAAVLEGSTRWNLGKLDRIVARASGAFPTVGVPKFDDWMGNTMPMLQSIVGSLVAAGVLNAPAGKTSAEFVNGVRDLWRADPTMLERTA